MYPNSPNSEKVNPYQQGLSIFHRPDQATGVQVSLENKKRYILECIQYAPGKCNLSDNKAQLSLTSPEGEQVIVNITPYST